MAFTMHASGNKGREKISEIITKITVQKKTKKKRCSLISQNIFFCYYITEDQCLLIKQTSHYIDMLFYNFQLYNLLIQHLFKNEPLFNLSDMSKLEWLSCGAERKHQTTATLM